jgi:HAD superfamily hydrolase (TIGR01484 family)
MKYKLLILDVDGTILPYKFHALPSPRVTKAIKEASRKVTVAIATGRPYFMMTHIFRHLAMDGLAIINDGAQVIDIKTKRVLYKQAIEKRGFIRVMSILRHEGVSFMVHDQEVDIPYTEEYTPVEPLNLYTVNRMDETLADKLVEKISKVPNIKVNKTHWGDGESADSYDLLISHSSATKLHGIYQVAKIKNVETEEIIGVGDSGNDFPLLMASGMKVAMGNAIPDLKAIADYVAPSVYDDGVADVINRFILEKKIAKKA